MRTARIFLLSVSLTAAALAAIGAAFVVDSISYAVHYGVVFPSPHSSSLEKFSASHIVRLTPYIFLTALVHAIVLGLPAFLWLERRGKANAGRTTLAGFAVGALPTALLLFPFVLFPGGWSRDILFGEPRVLTDDGATTFWGWIRYLETVLSFGACGAAGAFAFWLVWRKLRDAPSSPG